MNTPSEALPTDNPTEATPPTEPQPMVEPAPQVEPQAKVTEPEPTLHLPTTDLLCPACKAALPIEEGKLPIACPSCAHPLRPRKQKALNQNFILVWKKTRILRGRAPRREFWGFAILMSSIGLILALLLDIFAGGCIITAFDRYIMPLPEIPGLACAVLGSMTAAAILAWLIAVPLPFLSLTTRRLHDTGHSMLWLVATVLCAAGSLGTLLYASTDKDFPILWYTDNLARALEEISPELCQTLTYAAGFGILTLILGMIVLLFCLMDSQRGTNKYGPSVKYPLE